MSRILSGCASQTLGSKPGDGRGASQEGVFPFTAELVEREIEAYEPASVERCVGTVRFFNRCADNV
jgi:hypothetical protein